ncbi:MAG: DnaJ C-terminal domain-containing protein [Desulfovibrionaceae bacterium]
MSVSYKDYYAVLGVEKTATKDTIAKAFKKLAKQYHPDLNQNNAKAEEKFKEINEAYEVLKDDEKRKQYDAIGSNWNGGGYQDFSSHGMGNMGGESGFSSFFETLFGRGSSYGSGGMNFDTMDFGNTFSRQQENLDTSAKIEVTLEEIALGKTKIIALQDPNSGVKKNIEITIPQNIKNGAKIRLKGKGRSSGPRTGDLYIELFFAKHNDFIVDGADIKYTLKTYPWVAVLGGLVTVPTLYGGVEIQIAPNTKSGTKLRVQGKGLSQGDKKGNQIVIFEPSLLPEEHSEESIKAWETVKKSYKL